MEKKTTILIGDRNKNIREFLKRELMAEGYNVKLAPNGREILNMVNGEDPPDLLIMDIFVQMIDGLIVLEQIKRPTPNIPVVVYTSLVEYKDHPIVKSADAFIEKNGQIDKLTEVVFKLLNKSASSIEKETAYHEK